MSYERINYQDDYYGMYNYGETLEVKKTTKKPFVIGFFIFLILAILLTFLIIWFFVWRNQNNPLIVPCASNNQCLPNEVCKDGICQAVVCLQPSDCSGVANGTGGAICLGSIGSESGYCQVPSCVSNSDCSDLGDDYVCTVFQPDRATLWITSSCVKIGGTCTSNTDCYGGNVGLVCDTVSKTCKQCRNNGDCGNTDGQKVCSDGVCVECDGTNLCAEGLTCNNHLCCDSPPYMVNGTSSCVRGQLFDQCETDNDCLTGKCLSLGTPQGGGTETKICGGGSQGKATFSAGLIINGSIGDLNTIKDYTCPNPGGIDDTTSKPFAVDGDCSYFSSTSSLIGSACGKPSFCRDAAHSNNLLCNGSISFQNPYAIACKNNNDCPTGQGCTNGGLCSKLCKDTTTCPSGFVCKTDNLDNTPPQGFNGICTNPVAKIQCDEDVCKDDATKCDCPNGYVCGSGGICVWQSTGTGSTPPPPFVITSACTRPATAYPSTSNAFPSYCANGFCNSTPGWINSTCNVTGDCMFLQNNPNTGFRTSLTCDDDGTGKDISVCTNHSNI